MFFSTDDVITQDIALELPTNVLEGSARASFSVVGKYVINKNLKRKIWKCNMKALTGFKMGVSTPNVGNF